MACWVARMQRLCPCDSFLSIDSNKASRIKPTWCAGTKLENWRRAYSKSEATHNICRNTQAPSLVRDCFHLLYRAVSDPVFRRRFGVHSQHVCYNTYTAVCPQQINKASHYVQSARSTFATKEHKFNYQEGRRKVVAISPHKGGC